MNNIDFFKVQDYLDEGIPEGVRVFLFIVNRNAGKTYSNCRECLKVVENGGEFIYMRRNIKNQLEKTKDKLFASIPDCPITCDGYEYYYKDKETGIKRRCGYAVALSSITRGMEYPNVKYVFFDEFTTKGNERYLNKEFEQFALFLESVIRLRDDCVVVMCGNAGNFYNPYTIGWQISLSKNQKRWTGKNGRIRYYKLYNESVATARSESLIGQLFEGTAYDEWAGKNVDTENTDTNIKQKSAKARYYASIRYDGLTFTFWIDGNSIITSFSTGENRAVYTLDKENISEGEYYFHRQSNQIQRIRFYAQRGLLYYESQKVKSLFMPVLAYILRY